MIYYVSTASHVYTMGAYLVHWGAPLQSRVQLVTYDELFDMPTYFAGTYIFTDFDRLRHPARVRAATICDALEESGLKTLNHPLRSLRRYDLLRMLHERDINSFGVYRASERPSLEHFPVLVRPENEHQVCSDLLHTPAAVNEAITLFETQGHPIKSLILTEFCDTSTVAGIFRKSGMFLIGDSLIPRGLYVSTRWNPRFTDLLTPDVIEEERNLAVGNAHENLFRAVFRQAGIEFGRADYSLLSGKPQIWEINTNPIIIEPPHRFPPELLPIQQIYAERILHAFEQLYAESPTGFSVPAPAST